jgi:hypothetical protein
LSRKKYDAEDVLNVAAAEINSEMAPPLGSTSPARCAAQDRELEAQNKDLQLLRTVLPPQRDQTSANTFRTTR